MMIMVHTTHHFFDSVVIANLRASLASNTSTSFYRTQVCHRIASAMVPDLPALSSLSKSWHNQQPDANVSRFGKIFLKGSCTRMDTMQQSVK